ncbi:MAG: FCD domain-containing protein [Woeseiaceae bacterium]|jgi:DNA-binding GntR family transcriptional regulator|nr:FCD domain-containing protein [Woeseiaceae bacterium]
MVADKSEPLIDSVYARLRDLILSNVFRAGQKLVDRDLAEQLGVSRTPVREALGRLTMVGLVEARNRRGYYVAQYTADQMSDLYEFRKILEVNAATLAAQNAQAEHLIEFDRILIETEKLTDDPATRAKTVEIDLQIHDLIARASGNRALHQAIKNLMDKVMCFIWVAWTDPGAGDPAVISAAHREHTPLLLSIKEKDAAGAAKLMGEHIDGAREELNSVLKARESLQSVVLAAR